MKKIMLSFSLLALVLTGTVSCSSDDNSSEKHKMQTLELRSLNGTTVEVNASVTFAVAIGTTAVEGAQIYVNGKQSANPFTFTEVGSYKVVAKKEGYNDSNEVVITVTKAVAESGVVGTWIPVNVNVNMMGAPIDMPYPKKENCEDDTLVFDSNQTVKFNYHDESCTVETTGAAWSINESGTVLNLNLFGQSMTVNVISNDATKLVFGAKGDQFEALIPILVPELASSIPPGMLGLIDVQLELKKQ